MEIWHRMNSLFCVSVSCMPICADKLIWQIHKNLQHLFIQLTGKWQKKGEQELAKHPRAIHFYNTDASIYIGRFFTQMLAQRTLQAIFSLSPSTVLDIPPPLHHTPHSSRDACVW